MAPLVRESILQPREAHTEQKGGGGVSFSPGSWDSYLPLPWDISSPGAQAVGLRLGFTPLAPLALRPLGSDWTHATCLPGPPACRQQMVGLLSLENQVSQFLTTNLSMYL